MIKSMLFAAALMICGHVLLAQSDSETFYIGASYGTSFSIGDFSDTDLDNPDAGFAKNGRKADVYGGYFLSDRFTLTAGLRYHNFETDVDQVIEDFNAANPGANFSGSTEDWESYYLLLGASYRFGIVKNFNLYPRLAIGPMLVSNPGITINAPNGAITQNFSRTSETAWGLGYEAGIGLRNDLGRHFSLMPTFTFGGGIATISDVKTTTDNVEVTSDYDIRIQSFNLGLSLAYRFHQKQ